MPAPDAFAPVFHALKSLFSDLLDGLAVKTDSATEYILVAKVPSPLAQHKGQPMWFGAVRLGRAYVSFHLMPLYFNEALTGTISPALRKRMQGKTCFNFKSLPAPELLDELQTLARKGFAEYRAKGWV